MASGVKLDYETKNSYMVTVTATDPDNLSASIDVTITVTNVDEAPEIMLGGLAISGLSRAYYAENDMDAVGTYTLAGPMKDRATLRIEGGADAGDFRLNNGMLMFRNSPDYEAPADADMRQHLHGHVEGHRRHVHGHPQRDGDGHQRERTRYAEPDRRAAATWRTRTDAVGTYMISAARAATLARCGVLEAAMTPTAFAQRITTGGELTFSSDARLRRPRWTAAGQRLQHLHGHRHGRGRRRNGHPGRDGEGHQRGRDG